MEEELPGNEKSDFRIRVWSFFWKWKENLQETLDHSQSASSWKQPDGGTSGVSSNQIDCLKCVFIYFGRVIKSDLARDVSKCPNESIFPCLWHLFYYTFAIFSHFAREARVFFFLINKTNLTSPSTRKWANALVLVGRWRRGVEFLNPKRILKPQTLNHKP